MWIIYTLSLGLMPLTGDLEMRIFYVAITINICIMPVFIDAVPIAKKLRSTQALLLLGSFVGTLVPLVNFSATTILSTDYFLKRGW
jgi:hypothetical protein